MTTIFLGKKQMNTGKGLYRIFVMAVLASLLSGCGFSANMNTVNHEGKPTRAGWDVVHLKTYQVTGQVVDIQGKPVRDCQVFLIKRQLDTPGTYSPRDDINVLKESYVGTTDSEGQYSLTFEPGAANDLWLTFNSESGRFDSKAVRLNDKMGDTLLDYPGKNPVIVNVVLDKI